MNFVVFNNKDVMKIIIFKTQIRQEPSVNKNKLK